MTTTTTTLLSGPTIAHLLGMPYSTFDNWVRRYQLCHPTVPASGSGSRRQFTELDLARTAILLAIDGDPARGGQQPKSVRLRDCARALSQWNPLPAYVVVNDSGVHPAATAQEAAGIALAGDGVTTIVDVAKVVPFTQEAHR